MKHKNFLLVTFFLTLFVFQQVQAGETMPPKGNPSQVSFAPPYAPLPTINVFVLWLQDDGKIDTASWNGPHKCVNPNEHYGCGIIDPERPTAPLNPVPITVDPYYLRDVITIEMNVGEIPPTEQELPALKAQAIAARTVASWKAVNLGYTLGSEGGWGHINNSTQYQVFIPGSYDDFPSAQNLIDRAITETQGQFLSYEPDGSNPDESRKTIDAEFGSDMLLETQTEHPADPTPGFVPKGYLAGVQDPISTSDCFVPASGSHDYGMSQRGAIRWAIGNTCPNGNGTDWPVAWTDYRQILVHYYTGIDILNGSGGKVAPDDRWNLLWHNNFESPIGTPPALTGGQTAELQIRLQNTSTTAWNANNMEIGYHWGDSNWQVANISQPFSDVPTGKEFPDATSALTIYVTPPSTSGAHTLHLDLRRNGGDWFSSAGWPDSTINVSINGASATPSSTVTLAPTSISIPSYTPTGTLSPTPVEGEWVHLGIWENIGCNTTLFFSPVTTTQFRFKMLSGGGWDNRISFYGYTSEGAAWFVNGVWQDVNNQSFDLYVGQERETNIFDPAIVNQQRFSVGCNDGEVMSVDVYYRITYQPTPTLQSLPTNTFTPAPTSCIGWCYWEQCTTSIKNLKLASLSDSASFIIQNHDRISDQAALLYRVRDELLSTTPHGEHYIDVYYEHSAEIAAIMNSHPDIAEQGLDFIDAFTPNLQALLDGQGASVIITNTQVQEAQAFLDAILPYASPEFQQTIAYERLQQPLEQFIGVTMNEALEYVEDGVSETSTPTITPTITPLPTATDTPTLTPTSTATKTSTPSPTSTPIPGLILADGFESGDFSAWEWANTDGSDLSITTQAAAVGNYGMQAVLDDGNELIVFDESPNEEDHFSTRFYFHPNSVQAPEGGFYLMSISSEETWGVACLWLDQQGDSYTLGLCGQDDDEDWYESEGVFIANEWQAVELEWKAATTPGANDGYIRLYVGDQLADSIENLDNDTQAVTEVSWGVIGNGFVANGTLYFDAYESRTGAHIGLHPNGPAVNPPPVRPDALFADDFESGDLSRWSPTRTLVDGGDLSVSVSAAYQSGDGLQVLIDDTTILQAVDSSPAGEDHYRARFYFDPNSIAMNSGSAQFIFDGVYAYYVASVCRLVL
jgi:hypothetical protein